MIGYPTLSKARRYMIVINLILGAVLTDAAEVITQLTMFVPLQFLYKKSKVWVALVLSNRTAPRRDAG